VVWEDTYGTSTYGINLGFGGHEEFLLIYDLLLSIDDLEFTNLGLLAGGNKDAPL